MIRILCSLLALAIGITLMAAELPPGVTLRPDGVMMIEDKALEAVIIHPGFSRSRQQGAKNSELVREKDGIRTRSRIGQAKFEANYRPLSPDSFHYKAEITMDSPLEVLGIALEYTLPARKRTVRADGRELTLPAEYDEKNWEVLPLRPVKAFAMELDNGSVLELKGNFGVRIQDGRKFNRNEFLVRFYFTPSRGTVANSVFEADFRLERARSLPVDLSTVVNMGFADETAGDGKGGWTDQGPENDLRMLKPGNLEFGGIRFQLIDPAANNSKSTIVLGRGFAKEASVDVKQPERRLTLLHAVAWPEKKVGEILVRYRDGSEETLPVEAGRDVGNWWNPANRPNASVAWSADNNSNYVGLFFSQFQLRRRDPVRLTFRTASPEVMWMIPAVTFTDREIPVANLGKTTYITEGKEWVRLDAKREIIPGSPLDFSGMLDAPAGKYGRIIPAPGGGFTFELAPEKRIRFVGTNLCFGANYLSRKEADTLADRLAATGYNTVRIHHHDQELAAKEAPDGVTLNPERLERLEYLFAALKKRGIYITTDVYVSRKYKKSDGIPEAVCSNTHQEVKALLPISPSARRNWEQFARNWLTHRNPHTGLTWAEDPALFMISFTNENNLYAVWNRIPAIGNLYRQAFPGWMKEHYPAEKTGNADVTNRRFLEFLYDCQTRCTMEQYHFLKNELKVAALLTDVNMHNQVPLALLRNRLDLVDSHKYHDHPSFPVTPWRLPMQFRQRSAVSALGNEVPEFLLAPRIFDKPYTVTEYKFCPPNRYRSEGGPLIGGYAALQGWDGIMQFSWAHTHKIVTESTPFTTFDSANDPLAQLSDRLTMLLFRRGDVRQAPASFAYRVPEDFWNSTAPVDCPVAFSRLGLIARIGTVVGDAAPAGITLLNAKQAAGEAPLPDPQVEALRRELTGKRIARSATGELRLDAGAGLFTISAQASESVTVARGEGAAGRLSIRGAKAPQTFSVSSLDGRPLGDSASLLAFHLTDTANHKMKFADEEYRLLESWGELPHLLRRDAVEVSLKLDGEGKPTVEALRLDGSSYGTIPSGFKNGVLRFKADPGAFPGGVMVYRISIDHTRKEVR